MKRQDKAQEALTEAQEREAWASLPKRPQRKAEAKTDFDRATVYARDEGIDPDAKAHGPTRPEAEAWLTRQGIPPDDCPLILAAGFGDTLRESATTAGISHTTVAKRLKAHAPTVEAIRNALKRGQPLPDVQAPTPLPAIPAIGKPLDWLIPWAREAVKPASPDWEQAARLAVQLDNPDTPRAVQVVSAGGPDYLPYHKPDAAGIVALIRGNPERLLDPRWNQLLAALVDLIEAAGVGESKRRAPWVVPQGKRADVAKVAREALQPLFATATGRQYAFPNRLLATVCEAFRFRVTELQAEYKRSVGEPWRQRIAAIRNAHPNEFQAVPDDRRLQAILTDDPLDVGTRLAESATEISAETFMRARKKCKPYPAPFWKP